jgi:hypothetical protein
LRSASPGSAPGRRHHRQILERIFRLQRLESVNTQSYGLESRGGARRPELVGGRDINYLYVRTADVVALSQVALDTISLTSG